MPCLLVILALLLPRVAIVVIALATDWLSRAFHGALLPVVGFFIMPYTTLAYTGAIINTGEVDGMWLILLIVAIIVDLGHLGVGGKVSRRKSS